MFDDQLEQIPRLRLPQHDLQRGKKKKKRSIKEGIRLFWKKEGNRLLPLAKPKRGSDDCGGLIASALSGKKTC